MHAQCECEAVKSDSVGVRSSQVGRCWSEEQSSRTDGVGVRRKETWDARVGFGFQK